MKKFLTGFCLILLCTCSTQLRITEINNIEELRIKGPKGIQLGYLYISVVTDSCVYNNKSHIMYFKGKVLEKNSQEPVRNAYLIVKNGNYLDTISFSKEFGELEATFEINKRDTILIGEFNMQSKLYQVK